MIDQIWDVVNMVITGQVDPAKIITDLTQVYNDGLKAMNECTTIDDVFEAVFDEYTKIAPLDDPNTCRDELEKTVPTIDSLIEDLES